jgi:alkanesulfonate monooxygenase SsuD/methylene tetrahydromethanopterin reductase-like flavin-dependent oxidoreductase (luciferase family)
MILTASFPSGRTGLLGLPQYRQLIQDAARVGFDAALFVRSAGSMLDAVPLIAALASVPSSIGLGASVSFDHAEPFHLARAFAAIDRLTAGRSAVVADLTAGADLAPAFGHTRRPSDPGARIAECLEVTTRLWDSWEDEALLVDREDGLFTDPDRIHRINHEGQYFTVRGPLNAPRPLQGWPVIVVPVAGDASRSLAAQMGDVALIAPQSIEEAQDFCAHIREEVAANGRRLQAIRILVDLGGEGLAIPGTPAELSMMMRSWHAVGACDGFNLILDGAPDWGVLALGRAPASHGTSLRDRLGLRRPLNRYAA